MAIANIRFRLAALFVVLIVVSTAGCGFHSRTQLARSEAEKLQLLTQLQHEQIRAASAEASRQDLQIRLAQAEKDAAQLAGADGKTATAVTASSDQRQGPGSSHAGWQERSIATALRSLAEHHPGLTPVENADLGALDTSLLFDHGQAVLKPDAIAALDEQTKLLHAATGVGLRVLIAGHADNQSEGAAKEPGAAGPSSQSNATGAPGQLELSAARATSVATYLRRRGIAEASIATVAMGARQPSSDGATPAGQARNRRVEIYLVGPQTPLLGANWRPERTR